MLRVDLINVQSIGEAHIIIEDNSIVEFVGNNSNGKSIFTKVVEYLTKGDLIHRDVREALIKDNTENAVILITLDKKQLGLVLQHELKNSFVMYVPNTDKEQELNGKIIRPLGDSDGVQHLIKQFGFRVYQKGDICLQIAPTFGAIPFVTTSGSTNSDIVTDITIDKVADEFIKSFASITFPAFKERIRKLTQEKEHLQMVLDNMESYDWHFYDEMADRMSAVYNAIASYKPMELKSIPVPNLEIVPVSDHEIINIPVITIYDYCLPIRSIGKELIDYVEILNGTCPTCGRPLFED